MSKEVTETISIDVEYLKEIKIDEIKYINSKYKKNNNGSQKI
ncbi:hypothetical protein [Anaeromicrobium sediminis]|nr:hypothetical protein [Anaeromicrobium sediminis]